jgi:hypothetical protein
MVSAKATARHGTLAALTYVEVVSAACCFRGLVAGVGKGVINDCSGIGLGIGCWSWWDEPRNGMHLRLQYRIHHPPNHSVLCGASPLHTFPAWAGLLSTAWPPDEQWLLTWLSRRVRAVFCVA